MTDIQQLSYVLAVLAEKQTGRKAEDILREAKTFFGEPQKHEYPVDEDAVNYIYSLYPTKCPVTGRSTGKCSKDKAKIAIILRKTSKEDLARIIQDYVDESVVQKTWLKNFATFLNNLPDTQESDCIKLDQSTIYQ